MKPRWLLLPVLLLGLLGDMSPVRALELSREPNQYTLTSWTAKDGLPGDRVGAIAQDTDGYLWLGTNAGLVRFDGVNFVPSDVVHGRTLPESEISTLCAARDGSLWVGFGGSGGVSRLAGRQLVNYRTEDGAPQGRVLALLQARDGTIWAGSFGGLSRFRNDRWERLQLPNGSFAQSVRSLYEDNRGNLWLATADAMFVKRAETDAFEARESSSGVRDIAGDTAGTIWITDSQRAYRRFAGTNGQDHPTGSYASGEGRRLVHDEQGSLWIGTQGDGLLRAYRRPSGGPTFERFGSQNGLVGHTVWSLFEDRERNIWVGTERGLTRVSRSRVTSTLRADEGVRSVRAVVTAQDDAIWVGNSSGLVEISADGGRKWYGAGDGLPSADITALHEDRNGILWVATTQGPARREGRRFLPVVLPPGVRLSQTLAMTTDQTGGVWLADLKGLFLWKNDALTPVDLAVAGGRSVATYAYADSHGNVWIGLAEGGLARYRDGQVRSYSEADGFAGGRVAAIVEDKRGVIWVGTTTGLTRFDNDNVATLRYRNRLPGITLAAIVDDAQDGLWLGLNAGILRLDVNEFDKAVADRSYRIQYRLYDASDGLRGSPALVGSPTAARRRNHTLWFVTDSGISIVNPRRLSESQQSPPVRIESVVADDRSFDPSPRLRLPAVRSKLQINYAALTYADSSKVRFRYLLEGFDTAWVDADASRHASYVRVPPGEYRFRVMAISQGGAWKESGAVWDFSIQPAFYQTAWFYAVCVLSAGLIVWAAWQVRLWELRRQFALVLAERTRMAREIHDTLLQSMVGLALQFDVLSSQADPATESTRLHLRRLRKQVEHHIREARHSICDLRSPMLETHDLATALREAGESVTADGDLRFEFIVGGKPSRCAMSIEEQLLRIGQEAVRNAVLHAQATVVRVELSYGRGTVMLRVLDDGRGFDPEVTAQTSGSHWGLKTMQERAHQIGARFSLVSTPGGGTTLETIAPLRANA